VSGSWTLYMCDAGRGTRVGILVEHPDLALPAPDPARVMQVMREAIAGLDLPDHRRALHSYAVRRGLDASFDSDHSKLFITCPGLEAAIAFNERGLVTAMSGTLGASH
jgi:hypothetical protein